MLSKPAFRRILLKLSGEALMGDRNSGIDPATVDYIGDELQPLIQLGVELAIVVGGGNFLRGARLSETGVDRISADQMGMLATVMNGIALQDAFRRRGLAVRLQTALTMPELAEPFIPGRAKRHLEKGRIVIFAAGTGNPYFSTDTAAALRAAEIGAEVIFKATKVDGVYSADPVKDPQASRFERISFREFLELQLKVMDATAISLCMEVGIPVTVFSLRESGSILRALKGEPVGTMILPERDDGRA